MPKEETYKSDLKAYKYAKRLLKKNMYHSDTIKNKLTSKYGLVIALNVINNLRNEECFNDQEYIKKLISLYVSRGYSIKRFANYLREKDISLINISYYTFELEQKSAESCYEKYIKKNDKKDKLNFKSKLYNYLYRNGFNNLSIEYVMNIYLKGEEEYD